MSILTQYSWPGNIRELQNAVERMVIMSEGQLIEVKDLSPHLLTTKINRKLPETLGNLPLHTSIENMEREIIVRTLQDSKSIRQAARKLEISHATLLRKMQIMNITPS
jgi:DNA-binding NtrC family response regulator